MIGPRISHGKTTEAICPVPVAFLPSDRCLSEYRRTRNPRIRSPCFGQNAVCPYLQICLEKGQEAKWVFIARHTSDLTWSEAFFLFSVKLQSKEEEYFLLRAYVCCLLGVSLEISIVLLHSSQSWIWGFLEGSKVSRNLANFI